MTTPDVPPLNGRFLLGHEAHPIPARAPRTRLSLQVSTSDPATIRPELILGESHLQPFHFLRTGDRLGRAVVKIRRADGACGTGFLVAPDVLLTNHHVLPDHRVASAALVLANYEAEPPEGTPGVTLIEGTPEPSRLFVTQDELDFTFCGVSGLEALGSIPLRRDGGPLGPPDVVNIIQHPRGRPKEVAIRDNELVRADLVVLHYACDTEPGSSGSPVFDHAWRLVAIHHASIEADSRSGGRRASIVDPGIRFLNEGIRLSAIALWLETSGASEDGQTADVSRLRSLFQGVDPRAGFFGALGRSPRGRSASEVVSEGPGASRGDVLDVAYWDLRSTSRIFLDRLDDLGLAIASMGVDLWLLSSVSPTHARALAEHLDTHFRLDYRHLPGPGDVAVLSRRSRSYSAEWTVLDGRDSLLVRVLDASGRSSTIHVLPLPGRKSSPVASSLASLPAGDWLLIGGPSARLDDADRDALLATGLDISSASARSDGALVLIRTSGSPVRHLFASPNLSTTGLPPEVVNDRSFPDKARHFGRLPIAARVVFGETRRW